MCYESWSVLFNHILLTRWTWVWVNSGSWWWTGRPGVLQFMGLQSQTQLSDWTELNWKFYIYSKNVICYIYIISTLYVSYPLCTMYHIHLICTLFIFIITLEVQRFERLEIQGINNLPKVIQLFSSRTRIGISGSYTVW